MTHKHSKHINLLAITVLFSASGLLLSASQCKQAEENLVVIPASDGTPPTIGMIVNDSKVNIDVKESSPPDTMSTNENKVSIVAGATDEDGGIKAVRLFAVFTYYRPAETKGPGLAGAPVKQDVSSAKVGESTLKNRFFQHNFDLRQERGSWDSIKIDVWTEGENFHGGKVRTPKVSILYP